MLARTFDQGGLRAEIAVLSGPNSASELVARKAGEHQAVVAVGGDGTINSVAGALVSSGIKRPLGLIPLGLSNCLALHWGMPVNLEEAAAVILRGRRAWLDIVLANNRVMLAFMGAGFDASVVDKVAGSRSGTVNDMIYVKAAWSTFWQRDWDPLTVEIDGRSISGEFHQVILSQIGNYAHYFRMRSGEGHFAYLFKGPGRRGVLASLLKTGWKRDLSQCGNLVVPVRNKMCVRSNGANGLYQIDGEAGGKLPVACEIKAKGLELLVP